MVGQSPSVAVDHYENFPVASWLCPARLRHAVRAIYAFARCADDLADEGVVDAITRLAALGNYRAALEAVVAGCEASLQDAPPAWKGIFKGVADAMHRHGLPAQPFRDLLSAFEQDVQAPVYHTRLQLLDYCSRSANPVGRLMLHLAGVDDAASLRQSDAICTALQLINFWQDLGVDVGRGRHYVPWEDLARLRLSPSGLMGADTDATRALVRDLVRWARDTMASGAELPMHVPGRLGWELRLVVHGGLRILDKIEAAGFNALAHRPTLSRRDAPTLLWRAVTMKGSGRRAGVVHDLR